jgi:ribose/xylose/arabinose/galactoside ABC-type transport system permease subunit
LSKQLFDADSTRLVVTKVRVIYTLVGVLVLGILDNGLTQSQIDSYIREILLGLIVISTVAIASLSKTRQQGGAHDTD